MSVYRRAGTRLWWIEYTAHGRRYQVSSGTADRRAADKREREILRSIELGTWAPPESAGQSRETIASYAERWTERRRKAGVRTADDEAARLRTYVLPALVQVGEQQTPLGSVALVDLRRPQVAAWLLALQTLTSATTGKRLAPRTVRHVYDVLRTMMLDAVQDELIAATPCTLRERKGELPKKRDADPRWRAGAVYTRSELEALIGSREIPIDRRVYYALLGVAGLRSSEAAGLRWRDYDDRAAPLGRLTVAMQIGADREERELKTEQPRLVPVHGVLAALLDTWRREGWPAFFLRHPRPDDLIVPSRAGAEVARAGSKARERLLADLRTLGLRDTGRARHALRATLVTLGTEDGALRDVLDLLVWAKPSEVRAGYQRFGWPALCAEVARLRIELRPGADVVTLGRGSGGVEIPYSPPYSGAESPQFLREKHRGGGIRSRALARENKGNSQNAADPARPDAPGFQAVLVAPMHGRAQNPYSLLEEAAALLRAIGRMDLAEAVEAAAPPAAASRGRS